MYPIVEFLCEIPLVSSPKYIKARWGVYDFQSHKHTNNNGKNTSKNETANV